MDDEDSDDLFDEALLLQDASFVSLTGTAANMSFAENADARDTSLHHGFSRLRTSSPAAHRREPSPSRRPDLINDTLRAYDDDHDTNDSSTPPPPYSPKPNAAVLQRIEDVYENIVDALLSEKRELSITLKIRNSQSASRPGAQSVSAAPTRRICFPGKTEDEAWRFTVILRILELMHEALRNDTVMSKRDIYYKDVALFGEQRHVDRYVDDIAFTFGVSRDSLNVTAVAKGLMTGAATFTRRDATTVNAANDTEGILIPTLRDIISVDVNAVRFILMVEKEATFRSIAASKFWQTYSRHGILLTGKGYPDLASRAMLRFLSMPSAQNGFQLPRVLGLVDFDPDGVAILNTYKHGSKALEHETEEHRVLQLQWLGLRSEHLEIAALDERAAQGLLNLNARERKMAGKMLEESCLSVKEGCKVIQRELQTMLMLNYKAELQLFDAIPNGMADFLQTHIA